MKIFGGSGSRRARKPAMTKPEKKQKPKKQRSAARVVLISVLVITLIMATAAGVWLAANVKPPSLSAEAPHTNDTTVNDPHNGDAPAVDLNIGDRIDDFFTFVVCATDLDETRTDNIMVVAFDTKNHTVNVMNIPRDTMSNVSKTGANRKINAAYGTAKGIEQTKKQVKQVMGFTPDKFIVVNFNGIAEIVDAIGGVDYEIPFPMMYADPTQKLKIHFPTPGMRHMDGEEVVDFLRWRKNGAGFTQYVPKEYENGDETRIAKQQEFLKHLAKEVLTLKNAGKAKSIADAVFKNVKTDITAGEMIWLSAQAFQVDNADINMFTLPGYAASSTAGNSTELSFYFINEKQALNIINTHFNPYDKKILSLDLVSGPTKGTKKTSGTTDDDDDDDRPSTNKSDTGKDKTGTSTGGKKDTAENTDDPEDPDQNTGGSGTSGGSTGGSGGSTGGNTGNTGGSGGSTGGNTGSTGGTGGNTGNTGGSGGSTGNTGGSGGDTPTPPSAADPES